MESDIVWEKFRAGTGSIEPFVLFFPDYSKGGCMSETYLFENCMTGFKDELTFVILKVLLYSDPNMQLISAKI